MAKRQRRKRGRRRHEWKDAKTYLSERSEAVEATGCWVWIGGRTANGYGLITMPGERLAHRVAYRAWKDMNLPRGLVVRHTCDNRLCVNPEHLLAGTYAENSQDMVDRGRACFGEKNPRAKLTEEAVQLIREIHAQGNHSQRWLAKAFGVTPATICMLLSRKLWRTVT